MQQVHEGYTTARKFFNHSNASTYDSVVSLTTFGRDSEWKSHILDSVYAKKRILELASGTGILSSMLLERSDRTIAGLDLTLDYIRIAREKVDLPFVNGTAELVPYRSEYFDAVVSSYLIKYVDIEKVVRECWRVLQPGGLVVFHDFTYPISHTMKVLWNSYFKLLRFLGIFVNNWQVVFNDLDFVIKNSKWIEQATEQLSRQGFRGIDCKYHTFGTAAIIYAIKP